MCLPSHATGWLLACHSCMPFPSQDGATALLFAAKLEYRIPSTACYMLAEHRLVQLKGTVSHRVEDAQRQVWVR